MRQILPAIMLVALLGCSRSSRSEQTGENYIAVCGVIGSANENGIANATLELYDSPKETADPVKKPISTRHRRPEWQVQIESSCSESAILACGGAEECLCVDGRTRSSADTSNRSTSL